MSPSVSRTFSDAFGEDNITVDEDGLQRVSYRDIAGRNVREGQGQGNQTPGGKTGNFGSKLKSLSDQQ